MEYKCNYCNKNYASYQSRCNHIRRYHKVDAVIDVNDVVNDSVNDMSMKKNDTDMKYTCIKCDKQFKFRQGRWAHEKICKRLFENVKDDKDIKIENIEKEMERQRDIIQKSLKIHPQTLKKINNQLNNSTMNNNTNNGVINNITTYVQLGNEDLVNVLSKSEKRGILNRKSMGINDLVELIHCSGKYKQFMNVYITNL